MFCKSCLLLLIKKLNADDIIILEKLYMENAILPQFSLSLDSIDKKLTELPNISTHNLYSSLHRLNLLNFIDIQKWSRKYKYYITEDGINALNLIKNI